MKLVFRSFEGRSWNSGELKSKFWVGTQGIYTQSAERYRNPMNYKLQFENITKNPRFSWKLQISEKLGSGHYFHCLSIHFVELRTPQLATSLLISSERQEQKKNANCILCEFGRENNINARVCNIQFLKWMRGNSVFMGAELDGFELHNSRIKVSCVKILNYTVFGFNI
jgi:hypothetical protein